MSKNQSKKRASSVSKLQISVVETPVVQKPQTPNEELITTEEIFSEDLQKLNTWITSLKENPADSDALKNVKMCLQKMNELIVDLMQLSGKFKENWSNPDALSGYLTKMSGYPVLYDHYEKLFCLLSEEEKKQIKQSFLDLSNVFHRKEMNVSSVLMKPTQRLLKYHLLFKEMKDGMKKESDSSIANLKANPDDLFNIAKDISDWANRKQTLYTSYIAKESLAILQQYQSTDKKTDKKTDNKKELSGEELGNILNFFKEKCPKKLNELNGRCLEFSKKLQKYDDARDELSSWPDNEEAQREYIAAYLDVYPCDQNNKKIYFSQFEKNLPSSMSIDKIALLDGFLEIFPTKSAELQPVLDAITLQNKLREPATAAWHANLSSELANQKYVHANEQATRADKKAKGAEAKVEQSSDALQALNPQKVAPSSYLEHYKKAEEAKENAEEAKENAEEAKENAEEAKKHAEEAKENAEEAAKNALAAAHAAKNPKKETIKDPQKVKQEGFEAVRNLYLLADCIDKIKKRKILKNKTEGERAIALTTLEKLITKYSSGNEKAFNQACNAEVFKHKNLNEELKTLIKKTSEKYDNALETNSFKKFLHGTPNLKYSKIKKQIKKALKAPTIIDKLAENVKSVLRISKGRADISNSPPKSVINSSPSAKEQKKAQRQNSQSPSTKPRGPGRSSDC